VSREERLFPASGGFGVSERRATLVGRATEMRELEHAYARVASEGVALTRTIVGASGLGKTRLVRDFLLRLRGPIESAPRIYRGSARPHGPAHEVFARVLRARFGLVEGMDAEAAKAQVRAQVASVLEDRKVGDVVYFLGQLLDLAYLDSPLIKAVEHDPQQLKWLRRAVIKHFLEADAASPPAEGAGKPRGPVVLVLDDLHAAHDESIELLAYLVESLRAPILLVCIARPELLVRRDDWSKFGGDRHKLLEVAPLSENDASAVMQDLLAPCGEVPAVDDLVDAACTLAGGNPGLLEQMVRIFVDTGVVEVTDDLFEDEKWIVHGDKLASVRLPLTVEDAVQARIAALTAAERDVLERAAAMGGVFWVGGVVATMRIDKPAPPFWSPESAEDIQRTRALLSELTERDYVLKLPDSTFSRDEEYVFKHNLEREALARITPPGVARLYHRAIADWLAFKEHVRSSEEYLATYARHRDKAAQKASAAAAYVEAAELARKNFSNGAAVEYFERGLELMREAEDPDRTDVADAADAERWISALHHYGDALQALGRNDDALVAFGDMLARAYRLDARGKGGAAHSRFGRLYRDTGRLPEAEAHLKAALALFESAEDERGIASTQDDLGKLHWLRGDYVRALEFTQRALQMRRLLGDRRSIALSLNNLGLVYQDSGLFREALEAFEQALRIRREIGDLVGVSVSLSNLGTVATDQRDDRRALTLFEEAYEVAKETGDRNRLAIILTNLGETHNRLGAPARAIQFLKQAEEIADELGDKIGLAEAVRGLGKAYLAQKDWTKARECTQRAVDLFAAIESKVQLGIALRSLGEVTAAGAAGGRDVQKAREHLRQSIGIFEQIGNQVELARSCRAYAEVLLTTPELHDDPKAREEAATYHARADAIFGKVRATSVGFDLPQRSSA
jgi:tetratricopeptide (TPR) repeat protein